MTYLYITRMCLANIIFTFVRETLLSTTSTQCPPVRKCAYGTSPKMQTLIIDEKRTSRSQSQALECTCCSGQKKNGPSHLCIDYRGLNAVTTTDAQLSPRRQASLWVHSEAQQCFAQWISLQDPRFFSGSSKKAPTSCTLNELHTQNVGEVAGCWSLTPSAKEEWIDRERMRSPSSRHTPPTPNGAIWDHVSARTATQESWHTLQYPPQMEQTSTTTTTPRGPTTPLDGKAVLENLIITDTDILLYIFCKFMRSSWKTCGHKVRLLVKFHFNLTSCLNCFE